MRFHRRRQEGFADSGASSDIAFLLIIYFIVIAGFNINYGFLMNLPEKDSTRLILKDDLMRFELDRTGSLLYQGEAVNQAAAEQRIRLAVTLRPNLAVVLSVAPETPWQRVVSFVELVQSLNVDSFSFSMKTGEGETS
ncbi:MAG: biopolymer transporter ExbD [Treponema sp.]|jgi:biopolymer transport protein ExbD|nr:biopolymer transporter ExbD [Treponema sp.]